MEFVPPELTGKPPEPTPEDVTPPLELWPPVVAKAPPEAPPIDEPPAAPAPGAASPEQPWDAAAQKHRPLKPREILA